MSRFLNSVFGFHPAVKQASPAARRRDHRVRPELEALDQRLVLTNHIHFDQINGALTMIGTAVGDVAHVQIDTKNTRSPQDDVVVATLKYGLTVENLTEPLARVKRIDFHGNNGDDKFTNDTGIDSVAYGEAGKDTLIGGSGHDVLLGGTGKDTLYGRAGNDYLDGSPDGAIDTLLGGAGADTFVRYSSIGPLEGHAEAGGTIDVHIGKVYSEDLVFRWDYNPNEGDVIVEHTI
jgi:Ca2+-binding RTX toxin-like protein